MLLILGLYSTRTVKRNLDWKTDFSLWSATVKSSPDSVLGHCQPGSIYTERKLYDQAISEYEKALKIYEKNAQETNELFYIYKGKGHFEKGPYRLQDFNKGRSKVHNNIGSIYEEKGFYEQAVAHYQKAIQFFPENPFPHWVISKKCC